MNYPKRVSSSLTLFFALFVPVFWIVFFGAFTVAVFIYSDEMAVFNSIYFRVGMLVFFLSGVVFLYFTLLRLKRVEVDQDFVYATNFLKTYRYPYHNISRVSETNLILFRLCTIYLVQKGSFGKKIHFLESRYKFEKALEEYVNLKIAYEQKRHDTPAAGI